MLVLCVSSIRHTYFQDEPQGKRAVRNHMGCRLRQSTIIETFALVFDQIRNVNAWVIKHFFGYGNRGLPALHAFIKWRVCVNGNPCVIAFIIIGNKINFRSRHTFLSITGKSEEEE